MTEPMLIVGGGLTGCTAARHLADCGIPVLLVEARSDLGGLCADDGHVPRYGPHYFHSDDEQVYWAASRYGWQEYRHSAVAIGQSGRALSWPLDRQSLSVHGYSLPEDIPDPANMEEAAISVMGRDAYEDFVLHYTRKMWGRDPSQMPASLFKRCSVRDAPGPFFSDRFCGAPVGGWTAWCQSMTDHRLIDVRTDTPYALDMVRHAAGVVYTGLIDGAYYHGIRFETIPERHRTNISVDVVNFCHDRTHYTRAQLMEGMAIGETPDPDGIPCYAGIPGDDDMAERADQARDIMGSAMMAATTGPVLFAGRMGLYRYIDMGGAIRSGMDVARAVVGV